MALQAPQPPQSSSLNDLLRQHCRDRLFVQPLHWTAKHLQVLGCRFVRTRQPSSSTLAGLATPGLSESEQSGEDSKAEALKDALHRLAYEKDLMVKGWGLLYLLQTFSNYRIIPHLPYVLPYHFPIIIPRELVPNLSQKLPLPLLWRYISSQASLPPLQPCHQRYSNTSPRLHRPFRSRQLSRKLYPEAQMERPHLAPPTSQARPSTAYHY